MPYENEYAGYSSVRRMAENTRVKELLSKHNLVPAPSADLDSAGTNCTRVTLSDLNRSSWMPDFVLSIDGSYNEVSVENGYPSAKVAYLTVTDVLLQLKKMQELDAKRPVDPRLFRETRTTGSADTILAGCNVTYDGEINPRASLRRGVMDLFREKKAFDDGETLLDTYHVLLGYKPSKPQNCPYGENCGTGSAEGAYHKDEGTYTCKCSLRLPLHSTDALRFHERFNPIGENGAVFGEVMQVLERLYLVHILRGLERRGYLNALSRLAVVLDGPLAVFGQPAWLSQSIYRELSRLNGSLKASTGNDMLIVGVEKSGVFVEHLKNLCEASDKNRLVSPVNPQTALLPTNEYIRRQVIFSEGTHPHGAATYFGRKLLYRTKSGAQIVATLPFFSEEQRDLSTATVEQFPRLGDALNLFDSLVSSSYPNALVPIALAHSEAAIPLKLGGQVLEKLARELIKP